MVTGGFMKKITHVLTWLFRRRAVGSTQWRSSPWTAVFALAFSPLAVGLALVLPHTNAAVGIDIGTGLIGGAFIGLVFAVVQYTMDKRNAEVDKETDLRLLLTSSRDLPGIDLSGRSLWGIYLQGKNLQGARLSGTDLSGATLSAANLEGAVLTGALLDKASLRQVQAGRARLDGSRLTEADLADADLHGATLRTAILDGADLTKAKLIDADLSRASLANSVLDGADLTGAHLFGVHAPAVRMARAMLPGSDLQCGDFTAAGMARADLSSAFLSGATFDRAVLIRANLSRAVAKGCSLAGADLTACRLTDADLRSANLTGAVLVGCDLRGADLTGAQIEGVQGADSVRADDRTRWPIAGEPAMAARATLADKLPRATRRLVVKPVRVEAEQKAVEILEEIRSQQRLARGGVQGVRVSLPLGARAPRESRVRWARSGRMPTWPSWWPGTAVLRVDVKDTPQGTALTGALDSGGWERVVLPPVALTNRPATSVTGTPYPSAVEELCARVLNEIDPRDGAPWLARAYVVHSVQRWDAEGKAARTECRRALIAAQADDPLGPVVNYALGALAYNNYDADLMRDSIDYFTVANASAGRLGESMEGLVGLCLTGMALAYSQLYHRFGAESEDVVSSGRTTAEMAVEITRRRLMKPGLTPVVRRNAIEGYALALYAEAFATHMTQREEDVRESIPLYEEAITRLEDAGLPVPAVLYNNLGYQHMTLEGLKEPGPDATKRYEKARALFEQSVAVFPDLHFGWANLGNVDRLLRNPAAAEDSYRQALDICAHTGTRYPQGWNELACVLLQLGKRDDEALESHRSALAATDSLSVRARLRAEYAESLVLVGKVTEAATVAEQGLAEDPDNRYCLVALTEARSADE
jgi:uncharacterized protein YjbI with pentapeptide repeats/tetratricopeptide (TPR) repeat protein